MLVSAGPVRLEWKKFLRRMRKWPVTKIVQQGRQAYDSPLAPQAGVIESVIATAKDIAASSHQRIEHSRCDVHDAERVLESGVRRARIYHVGPTELANPAEALKDRLIDHIPFKLIQANEPVNGIPDFIWLRKIAHVTSRSNIYRSFLFPICAIVKILDIVVTAIMITNLWQSASEFGRQPTFSPRQRRSVGRLAGGSGIRGQ